MQHGRRGQNYEIFEKCGNEFIEHSLSPLIKEWRYQYGFRAGGSEVGKNELYIYVKLNAFFLSFGRFNSYEEHTKEEKQTDQAGFTSHNNLRPVLKLPLRGVRSCLDLQNIDFIYRYGFTEAFIKSKSQCEMDKYL